MNYTTKKIIKKIIFHVFILAICMLMIYPILYMFFGSFKTQQDIFQNPTSLFPEKWHFKNYVNGWKGFGGTTFSTFFKNSIFITIIAVFVSGIICRLHMDLQGVVLKGRYLVFNYDYYNADATTGLIIPQYIMFNFGWANTWLPLIMPGFWYPFFIF